MNHTHVVRSTLANRAKTPIAIASAADVSRKSAIRILDELVQAGKAYKTKAGNYRKIR